MFVKIASCEFSRDLYIVYLGEYYGGKKSANPYFSRTLSEEMQKNVGLTQWEFCKRKEEVPVSLKAQQWQENPRKCLLLGLKNLFFLFAKIPNPPPRCWKGWRPAFLSSVVGCQGGGWSDNLCFGVQWSWDVYQFDLTLHWLWCRLGGPGPG